MEPQAKDPEESQTPPKKVLVCFGERRREVTFSSGGGKEGDISSLLDAVAKVFADVPAEDPMHQLSPTEKEMWVLNFSVIENKIIENKNNVVNSIVISVCSGINYTSNETTTLSSLHKYQSEEELTL